MGLSKPQSKYSSTLSQSLNSSDGVVYLTEDVVEDLGYLILDRGTASEEIVKYTSKGSGFVSGCIRGLSTVGTTETAGTGKNHSTGSTVEMSNVHFYFARVIDAINGVSSTSANSFIIGEGDASLSSQGNTFFKAQTSAGFQFQIGLSTNGYGVWTDDNGATYNRLSATGGAVNSGLAWENVGGVGNVKVSALISAAGGISSVSDKFVVNQAADYVWSGTNFDVSSTNFKIKGTKVSTTAEELNKIYPLSAYSTVTPYNLSLLTDGGSVSGANLHTHAPYFRVSLGMGSVTTATSSTTIFINTTFQPKLFRFNARSTFYDGSFTGNYFTFGSYDGTTYFCLGAAEQNGAASTDKFNILSSGSYLSFGWSLRNWQVIPQSVASSGINLTVYMDVQAANDLDYQWEALG